MSNSQRRWVWRERYPIGTEKHIRWETIGKQRCSFRGSLVKTVHNEDLDTS